MAAYHVKGNTIHSTLNRDINESKLTPQSHNEFRTLRSMYGHLKAVFSEEVSMIGKKLFNRRNDRLQQIMGTKKKPFVFLHLLL